MTDYFLGIDVGASKSAGLIADGKGHALSYAKLGPGTPSRVGYEGLAAVLQSLTQRTLASAGISKADLRGAGFGLADYDWPSQKEVYQNVIDQLDLHAPTVLVNDAIIGLVAGASQGWGVAVTAGTSCNCRGRDIHRRMGRVAGFSALGEGAGGYELVTKAIQAIASQWSLRGPPTRLTQAFVEHTGTKNVEELLEGLTLEHLQIGADIAPIVFQVAEAGDGVAQDLIRWAGRELASLAVGVIRQLHFETIEFEVVLVGSLFKGGSLLISSLQEAVLDVAPKARFVLLEVPPVVGAVLLGMESAGLEIATLREPLICSTKELLKGNLD